MNGTGVQLSKIPDAYFDVLVCGGGLAGLCLARQLRLEQPDVSVAVVDPSVSPLPKAAWKVGESTVEFGAHYLAEYLHLRDYLQEAQLVKLGLRFFFPSQGPLSTRPELGLSDFAPVLAYQLDRGILETDMRDMARKDGTLLLEGCQVRSVDFGEARQPHVVRVTDLSPESGGDGQLRCRWLVDASGRRQLIQRQLGLRQPSKGTPCSAAWFRLDGRRDVDDLVGPEDSEWHDRVRKGIRYYSTNHLCGQGYWVWLIPLSSNTTSVGIVARNDMHAFQQFNTYERALDWLRGHEPDLARYLGDGKAIDFRAMKDYSYTSEKIFSEDRWACVGEAGVFADPFYSPGTDLIAIANTMTCDLIRRDLAGNHDAKRIKHYSDSVIGLNDLLTKAIQHGYAYLGDEMVSLARGLWDYSSAWGHLCPQVFNRTFVDDEKQAALRPKGRLPIFALAELARSFFDEWLERRSRGQGRLTFDFFNYLKVPWLAELRLANLRTLESVDALRAQYESNIELLEGLLQALFLLAVEDLWPEEMGRLADVKWMNVQRLTLDPLQWDASGMFQPQSRPRDFRYLYDELRIQLRAKQPLPGSEAATDNFEAAIAILRTQR
jgi:flavin-dependent dehydrogenase